MDMTKELSDAEIDASIDAELEALHKKMVAEAEAERKDFIKKHGKRAFLRREKQRKEYWAKIKRLEDAINQKCKEFEAQGWTGNPMTRPEITELFQNYFNC